MVMGPQFEQQRLFDDSQYESHPGNLSYETWLQHPDIRYHGTLRRDAWNQSGMFSSKRSSGAPYAHFGTMDQARDLMRQHANYISSPSVANEGLDPVSERVAPGDVPGTVQPVKTYEGSIYARRLPMSRQFPLRDAPLSDDQANTVHALGAVLDGDEPSGSVAQSSLGGIADGVGQAMDDVWNQREAFQAFREDGAGGYSSGTIDRVQVGVHALQKGRPVRYLNEAEGETRWGSPTLREESVVVRADRANSWEDDVLEAQKTGTYNTRAADFVKQARERDPYRPESTVPIPAGKALGRGRPLVEQQKIFGTDERTRVVTETVMPGEIEAPHMRVEQRQRPFFML
jgi:hypothetical protein